MPEAQAVEQRCSSCEVEMIAGDRRLSEGSFRNRGQCNDCDPAMYHCTGCDEYHWEVDVTRCDVRAGFCRETCGCYSCDDCGDCLDGYHCEDCHFCDGCARGGCESYHESGATTREPTFFEREPVFHKGKVRPGECSRFMSAEMEIAGSFEPFLVADVADRWSASVVRDGSLPRHGYEINTSPSKGSAYIQQLTELEAALKKAKSSVTTACGCHVHIDARDMVYQDIRRLVIIYARLEEDLFNIVSSDRRSNDRYCQRCGPNLMDRFSSVANAWSTKGAKLGFFQAVYDTGLSSNNNRLSVSRSKQAESRYNALNLHSWMYRGTIENRMHQGTMSAKDIYAWSHLNGHMLDAACRMTDEHTHEFFATTAFAPLEKRLSMLGVPEWIIAWAKKRVDNNGKTIAGN